MQNIWQISSLKVVIMETWIQNEILKGKNKQCNMDKMYVALLFFSSKENENNIIDKKNFRNTFLLQILNFYD